MKLDEITKVHQTSNVTEANEHLARGFRILKILSTKITTSDGEFIQPTYVLGLTEEKK